MSRTRPWADLSPDLLFDVSGRLHDAADFVRFHAVCKPWRDSASASATRRISPAARPMFFMPWLLAPCEGGRILHSAVNFVSSKPAPISPEEGVVLAAPPDNDSFVVSADGTAAWLFTTSSTTGPGLLDVITGAVTHPLPSFSAPADGTNWPPMEDPRGVVYGDGTVFLYEHRRDTNAFTAAVLRPGDAAWTPLRKRLGFSAAHHYSGAAYHDGKVMICSGRHFSCALALTRWDEREEAIEYDPDYREDKIGLGSYLLESRGELLLASVLMEAGSWHRGGHAGVGTGAGLSVSVHALEKANGGGGGGKKKMRWAPRDGRSLGDRVLFLGRPVSFARDAAAITGGSGCAYFVYKRRVFRHSFVDKETKLVKGPMPGGWGAGEVHVWLQPRPAVAPMQEIAERLHARTKQEATSLMR